MLGIVRSRSIVRVNGILGLFVGRPDFEEIVWDCVALQLHGTAHVQQCLGRFRGAGLGLAV